MNIFFIYLTLFNVLFNGSVQRIKSNGQAIRKEIRIEDIRIDYRTDGHLLTDTVRYYLKKQIILKQFWSKGKLLFEENLGTRGVKSFEEIQLKFYTKIIYIKSGPLSEGAMSLIEVKNIEGLSTYIVTGGTAELVKEGMKIVPNVPKGSKIEVYGFYAPLKKKVLLLKRDVQ